MARMASSDGALSILLEDGESVCVEGGGQVLWVQREGSVLVVVTRGERSTGQPAGIPSFGKPDRPGASGESMVPREAEGEAGFLTAPEAILEILNVFQQVNVRSRRVKELHGEDTPEHTLGVNALKVEAMDRVVEVCRRYQLQRLSDSGADSGPQATLSPKEE